MLIFKVILIGFLLFQILIGLAIKYNWNNYQDKLISMFMKINIEYYLRYYFPDILIFQMIFLLCIFILTLC